MWFDRCLAAVFSRQVAAQVTFATAAVSAAAHGGPGARTAPGTGSTRGHGAHVGLSQLLQPCLSQGSY